MSRMRTPVHLYIWEQEPEGRRFDTPVTRHGASPSESRRGVLSDGERTRDPASRRAPPLPRDLVLSPLVPSWLASLPPELQPRALCHLHPRIANQLAMAWPDRGLTAKLFATLLCDTRSGRRGFSSEVSAELKALRDAGR